MLYHFVTICSLLLLLFLPQSQALEPGELQQKAEEAVRTWKRVQELEDRWATEREGLLKEIERLEAQRRNGSQRTDNRTQEVHPRVEEDKSGIGTLSR